MKSAWPENKPRDMRLLRIAEGDLPKDATEYLQLKAIEALGRLRTDGRRIHSAQDRRNAPRLSLGQPQRIAPGGFAGDGENRSRMGARLRAAQRLERRGIFDRAARSGSKFFGDPAAALSAPAAGTPRAGHHHQPEGKLPPRYSGTHAGRRCGRLRAKPASGQRGESELPLRRNP